MSALKSKQSKEFMEHIALLVIGLALIYPVSWLVETRSLSYAATSMAYASPLAFVVVGLWAPAIFLPKKLQSVFLAIFFLVLIALAGKVVETGVNRALHAPNPAPIHTRPAKMWSI